MKPKIDMLFEPTHRITPKRGPAFDVMLRDGIGYQKHEWEHYVSADYEVVDGKWVFQGEPFAGKVEKI
jgi:hypothetical protein